MNGSATVGHRGAAELPPSAGGDGTSAVRRSPAVRGLPAGHTGSSAGQMVMLAGNMVILLGKMEQKHGFYNMLLEKMWKFMEFPDTNGDVTINIW